MAAIPKTPLSQNLDSLRAFAVLCVYVSHLLAALHLATIGSLGRFGVILFFIHTSLVLMQSMDRLECASGGRGRLLGAFWLRRAFRIYPLSTLIILIVLIFHIPPDPNATFHSMRLGYWLANLALTQNLTTAPACIGPLWSLPLEMQMYLVLPFLHFFLQRQTWVRGVLVWLASVPAAILLPHLNWRLQVAYFAPCFCAGVLAYALLHRQQDRTRRLPAWVWPLGLLAATLAFAPWDNVAIYHKPLRTWCLALAVSLLYVETREPQGERFRTVFHWIAEHSYSIYLSHILLFWFVLHRMDGVPPWLRGVTLVSSSIAIPAALYRWVERPLMLAGAHLSRRILRPAPALAESVSKTLPLAVP